MPGLEIRFQRNANPREAINAYIEGYSTKLSDNDIIVEDANRHIGVEQTSDRPISRILFWTNGKPVCPEVYLHVPAAPGQCIELESPLSIFCSCAIASVGPAYCGVLITDHRQTGVQKPPRGDPRHLYCANESYNVC